MPENSTELKELELEARLTLWSRFDKYAPACLKVQSEENGELVPFQLNEIQVILQDIIKHIREAGRLIRLVILKARREGISTWGLGRGYWKTTSNANRYGLIIAHDPESTDFLFNMIKRYNAHCPPEFKPDEKYNNKKQLEFNNSSGTGLDSAIRVGCAGKEDLGSGMKIDFLHLSELAKWDKNVATALLTSLLQTIPNDPTTEVIMESTAKGIGGEFYDRFWGARYVYTVYLKEGKPLFRCEINKNANESNEYSAIFIPWFVFSKYRRPVPVDFKATEKEITLKELHGLDNENLVWRRWCIANRCNGSEDIFKQEYPSTAAEAFLAAGYSVFNSEKILTLKTNAPDPKVKYEINTGLKEVVKEENGRLWVWKEPDPSRKYIMAVDVSEGIAESTHDFSSIDVIDWITGEQVAHWHGKIAADQLAIVAYTIGRRYNWAFAGVERNGLGLLAVTRLVDMDYPELYVETQHEPPHKPRKRFGWTTTRVSKPVIIGNLMAEVQDGSHGINCEDTFDEMLTYKQEENGEYCAERGHFDDRVMSLAIAKYLRVKMPIQATKARNQDASADPTIKIQQKGDLKSAAWG